MKLYITTLTLICKCFFYFGHLYFLDVAESVAFIIKQLEVLVTANINDKQVAASFIVGR